MKPKQNRRSTKQKANLFERGKKVAKTRRDFSTGAPKGFFHREPSVIACFAIVLANNTPSQPNVAA